MPDRGSGSVRAAVMQATSDRPRPAYTGGMGSRVIVRRRFIRGSVALAGLGLLGGCGLVPSLGQRQVRVPLIGFLAADRPGPTALRSPSRRWPRPAFRVDGLLQ